MALAKVISVIQVASCDGAGTTENPYRTVTEYFSQDGELLAKSDPCDGDEVQKLRQLNNSQAEMIARYIQQIQAAKEQGVSFSWDGRNAVVTVERPA